jgi:hypothetical protein
LSLYAILVFPVSIVLAVGLNRGREPYSTNNKTAITIDDFNVDSCNGLFIIVEQFNTAPSDYSKQQQLEICPVIQAPPPDAAVLLCFRTQVYRNPLKYILTQ